MVGTLIRMKIAVMRRSATGSRAQWMLAGLVAGLAIAGGTIYLGTLRFEQSAGMTELLAFVLGSWAFGWMLGPAWAGEPALRAEHFALQPIPRKRLAIGLLASAFVGITTGVSLVAFTVLVVFGARLGVVPALVAVPGVLLQLALVVVLSRLTALMFGALARSRTGAAINAIITAAMLVAASSGWVVFVALDAVLASGFSSNVALTLRWLPSSWTLVAIEAADRADWALVAAALGGLVALIGVLVALWTWLLGPQRLPRPVVRGSSAERAAARGWAATGGTQAVFVKELRTWRRDPLRVQTIVVAPTFAILSCLVPLAFDSTVFLPFAGALTALMAAVTAANLYGQDGTALWLTLVTPDTEKADVRGRQLAWLALFGPMSLLLTAAGMAIAGHPELWPWALTATAAVLGAGAGLLPLIAIGQLVPGPDPHQNRNSPLDHGDVTGQSFLMMFSALLLALPALIPVIVGTAIDNDLLRWAGVPLGVLTGVLGYHLLGRGAYRTLRQRGPDLLYLMQAGKEQLMGAAGNAVEAMSKGKQYLLYTSLTVGFIALFPQAIVPTVMKLIDEIAPVWFLALHMPPVWQWPVVAAMYALAIGAFTVAGRIYLGEMRAIREAQENDRRLRVLA